jgi:hypothetical protein
MVVECAVFKNKFVFLCLSQNTAKQNVDLAIFYGGRKQKCVTLSSETKKWLPIVGIGRKKGHTPHAVAVVFERDLTQSLLSHLVSKKNRNFSYSLLWDQLHVPHT